VIRLQQKELAMALCKTCPTPAACRRAGKCQKKKYSGRSGASTVKSDIGFGPNMGAYTDTNTVRSGAKSRTTYIRDRFQGGGVSKQKPYKIKHKN